MNDLTDTLTMTSTGSLTFGGTPTCPTPTTTELCSFVLAPNASISTQVTAFTFDIIKVNMFEDVGQTIVSDLLNRTDTGGFSSLWTFTSDVDGGTTLQPFVTTAGVLNITENGLPQTVVNISYLNANALVLETDTIQIQSDVEGTPEPSTWLMAASGLGLVLLRACRYRFAQAKNR
jgi:hypothetical protein